MSKRRVVVTGLGMLSPVGNTAETKAVNNVNDDIISMYFALKYCFSKFFSYCKNTKVKNAIKI